MTDAQNDPRKDTVDSLIKLLAEPKTAGWVYCHYWELGCEVRWPVWDAMGVWHEYYCPCKTVNHYLDYIAQAVMAAPKSDAMLDIPALGETQVVFPARVLRQSSLDSFLRREVVELD